jgi:DNA-binding response OmpR family regulator
VKELVTLSKGTIIANNLEDNKIQFTVSLPIHKEAFLSHEIIEQADTEQINEAQEIDIANKDQSVILVVEDDPDIRNFVSSIFNANYKVVEAANGEEGIQLALKHVPDIVISDIMMPITDGIELCNTIKYNQLTSHIPIILLTAKVGEEHKITGLKSGADAYITKPFNNKLLTTQVEQLLANRIQLKKLYSEAFTITPELAITSTEAQFLKHLKEVLDAHITNPDFRSEDLSKRLHLSRTHLHRKLKAVYGLSTSEFMRSQRVKLATILLKESDATISEIAYQIGFNSSSYFIKSFKEMYDQTPTDYRLDN